MALRVPEPERASPWGLVVAVALALAGLVVAIRTCGEGDLGPGDGARSASSAPSSAGASSSVASAPASVPALNASPPAPARCVDVARDAFVIGDAPAPRPAAAPSDDAPIPAGDDPDDPLAPFAVSLGRGATFDGGFAVGALRDAEGGTVAMIATLSADGKDGKLTRLARSRGDLEPPVLAGAGSSVLAVMLEPNAAGRSLKIAKVAGGEVTWGAELAEGRDESLAVDLATAGERAVIVWDDVLKDTKRSSVILASFDVASLRSTTQPRPVSPPSVDADSPRVVARPGGYWLAYVAQAAEKERADRDDPSAKPKSKRPAKNEIDEERGGEAILNRWLEVIPLDETGAAVSAPRAVTPKNGHVLGYDVELGEDGAVLLAWRDDDTPSGSSGGRVSTVLVRLGGVGEARVVAEEGVGAGVPELLPGWLFVAALSGPARLGPVTPAGELAGELIPEASLGVGGEALAATKAALLVARPAGKAMKLSVMKCTPSAAATDSPPQ
jgi:hypothetical protein